HYVFSDPQSENLSTGELDTVKKFAQALKLILSLIEIDFKPSVATESAEDDGQDGDADAEEEEKKEEKLTEAQLLSITDLIALAQDRVQLHAYNAWVRLRPGNIISALLALPENTNLNTDQIWTWYQNE